MEELDKLKNDWKKRDHGYKELSEDDIYRMLHRKSSSIVKWILIISVLEVIFWTVIGLADGIDDYLKQIRFEGLLDFFTVLTYLNYAVILAFIVLFYRNYRSITTTASTRQLMKDILRTRKTVQYYVYYNLGMVVLSFIIGLVMALVYSPKMDDLREKIMNESKYMVLILIIGFGFVIVAFFLFWLFYRLLYGILLRKLLANYRELKKIDL